MPSTLRLLSVPLALAALLLVFGTAHAAPSEPQTSPLAFEEELELEEEGEFESEACEVAEEELEAGEIDEAVVDMVCGEAEAEVEGAEEGRSASADSASATPAECMLRSAHARAVTPPRLNKLKLTLGYTAYEPVVARVEIRGGKGRIGSTRRHLGRSGVLRIVENLGGAPAPKRIVVRIRISGSPGYCGKFQTEKVWLRKTA